MDKDEIIALTNRLKNGVKIDEPEIADAVRSVLGVLKIKYRGKAAELRVAPYGAIQILEGHSHRRGTPSTVVAFEPTVFLSLWSGEITTSEALNSTGTRLSGNRSGDVLKIIKC